MGNQRIEAGALLGGINPGDCFGPCRIGAKAINGLGRECDQSAGAQDLRGRPGGGRASLREFSGQLGFDRHGFARLSRPIGTLEISAAKSGAAQTPPSSCSF